MRVVIKKCEGMFVAQGVDHDVLAQAEDLASLLSRFEATVEFEGVEGLGGIGPAPDHLFKGVL
jgi:hypothetical protein